MAATKPTFYKVDIKPKKKEPCRICNTKIRPTIDILGNKDLLESITSALDLMVFPESRLSKRICVICMTLVNLLADFKKVCYDTQNDLWKMEQNLVCDRSIEVTKILNKAKQISIFENQQPQQQSDGTNTTSAPKQIRPPERKEKNAKTVPQMKAAEESPSRTEGGRQVDNVLPKNYLHNEDEVDDMYDEFEMEEKLDEFDDDGHTTETAEEKIEDAMDVDSQEDDEDESEVENNLPQFKCRLTNCEQSFSTKEELKEHLNQHKQNLSQVFYKCHVCPKTFLEISELVAHRKTHSTPNSQKCGYCRTEFPVDIIAKHVVECALMNKRMKNPSAEPEPYRPKQIIVPPDEKLFKCGICGERAATITDYRAHFATHWMNKWFIFIILLQSKIWNY